MLRAFSGSENRYTAVCDAGRECGQALQTFGRYPPECDAVNLAMNLLQTLHESIDYEGQRITPPPSDRFHGDAQDEPANQHIPCPWFQAAHSVADLNGVGWSRLLASAPRTVLAC
jgi:hypothetical protein